MGNSIFAKGTVRIITIYKKWYRKRKGRNSYHNESAARRDLDGFDFSGQKVLDAGCGIGYHTYIISEAAKSVVGVDVNEESLLQAKELAASKAGFVRCDLDFLPFKDNSFDRCISIVVMPYVNEEKALTEISRVLKDHGLLLVKHNSKEFLGKIWHKNLSKWLLGSLMPKLKRQKDYLYQLKLTTAFDERFISLAEHAGLRPLKQEAVDNFFIKAIFIKKPKTFKS